MVRASFRRVGEWNSTTVCNWGIGSFYVPSRNYKADIIISPIKNFEKWVESMNNLKYKTWTSDVAYAESFNIL